MPLRDSLAGRVLRGSGEVTYHLRECIGEGGQGWVFRANWDDPSGHVVIVKVLRPDSLDRRSGVSQGAAEFRLRSSARRSGGRSSACLSSSGLTSR